MAEEGLGVSPTADLNEKALIMPAGTFFIRLVSKSSIIDVLRL